MLLNPHLARCRHRNDDHSNPSVCGPGGCVRFGNHLHERRQEGPQHGRRDWQVRGRVPPDGRDGGDGAESQGAQLLQEIQVKIIIVGHTLAWALLNRRPYI